MKAALHFAVSEPVGTLLKFLVGFLLSCLKHINLKKWEEVTLKTQTGDTYSPISIVNSAPGAFKSISLETIDTQGFHGGALGQDAFSTHKYPQWLKEVQTFLANQLSPHTQRAYQTDLKQFFKFLENKIPLFDITQLKREHIILFRKHLEEGRGIKKMAQSTINRKLAVIKSLLTWLEANNILKENPAKFVKGYPQSQESTLLGFSDQEVFSILQIPRFNNKSGSLHTAILCTLFYLGLRKGELIQLKVGDLDEERGVKILKVRGKGHKVRTLPLVSVVDSAIHHYFKMTGRDESKKEDFLFWPTKNPKNKVIEKALNPNAISYIVKKYSKKAGVLKKVSPHSCRATCISHALDKKASHRSVQHLAGWSTPLMIQRYDKRREELKNSAAFSVDYEGFGLNASA